MTTRVQYWCISLALGCGLLGCAWAQTFIQESGEAHKKVEQMNWVNEPSAEATNWSTYGDLEGH